MVGSWAICAVSYTANRGNSLDGVTFVTLIIFAGALTVTAATTQAIAWVHGVGVVAAALTSFFAAAAALALAFAFDLSG